MIQGFRQPVFVDHQSPALPRSDLYLMNFAAKKASHSTVILSRPLTITTAGIRAASLLDRKNVSFTCRTVGLR